MKHHIYTGKTYRQLPINQNYHLIDRYLNSIYDSLNNALTQHPRTIIYNAILRLPKEASSINNDNIISRFIDSFKQMLKAELKRRESRSARLESDIVQHKQIFIARTY